MPAEIQFKDFQEHKVETDESLASIAKDAGISGQELAQFNWGTSEPTQINQCLRDVVGCTHTTRDGKNYRFTSEDDPGILYVPVKSPEYNLETGKTHEIQVIRPHLSGPETFIIDLHVDPASDQIRECVYSMLNEDGSVHQRRTAASDAIREENKLTLEFTNLHRGLRYTLEVDDGGSGNYYLFYKVPLERLIEVDANPQGTDEGPGDQELPAEYAALVFDETIPSLSSDLRQPLGDPGSGPAGYVIAADQRLATEGADQLIV